MRLGEFFLFFRLRVIVLYSCLGGVIQIFIPMFRVSIVVVVFTKRAQIPFRGWLPKAIRAPTPTRALVHSSTLVAAGLRVVLINREMFKRTFILLIFRIIGFITIVLGRLSAVLESRVKKAVAYRTLSQIGLCIIVFGSGNFYIGSLNLIVHGLAKSLLFIQIGYILHIRFNQQNIKGFQSSGCNEGFYRVQIICTLFSLCGIGYTRGMLIKEQILRLLTLNSISFIVLSIIYFSVFLTFFYSFLLYKFLFAQGFNR